MLHPLLSLWRPPCRVTFYDQGAGSAGDSGEPFQGMLPPLGTRRLFRNTEDAAMYVRYWSGEPSAQAELRWLLKRCAPSAHAGTAPDRWVQSLAALLVSGVVAVVEESSRRAMPGRLAPAPGSSSAAAAAAAVAALPALDSVPAVPAPENLLPALEDARIEGAAVLTELDQSLAQVTATMGQVEAAAANVEPAPNKVPDISTAMTGAADAAQQAIDAA